VGGIILVSLAEAPRAAPFFLSGLIVLSFNGLLKQLLTIYVLRVEEKHRSRSNIAADVGFAGA
jgi:hypothetical protein